MGQNFLKNPGVIAKAIDAAELSSSDTVLEIGPGQGALTGALLEQAGKVVAVEKDDHLFALLGDLFSLEIKAKKLELIHGDVMDLEIGIEGRYKLVANIPYNITGAIIEKFLSTKRQPAMMVLMVQKEVAERIVAKNKKTGGAGKESILSIAVKAYGKPSYISTVKAGNFIPAPKVDSAIIKIDHISRENFTNAHHEQVFFQIMKAGFAHKRKTIAGNLKNILEPAIVDDILRQVKIDPSVRAEDIGITDWLVLSKIVYNTQYGL